MYSSSGQTSKNVSNNLKSISVGFSNIGRLTPINEKPAQVYPERASFNNPGDFLLSHAVSHAVPSAPAGLTSVFGMGTGVTLPTKSPENFFGSGDPAVRRGSRFRLAQLTDQSPRYGTFEISDLRSEISESNSNQGKSKNLRLQIPDSKLRKRELIKPKPQTLLLVVNFMVKPGD